MDKQTYTLQGIVKAMPPPYTAASGFTKREVVVTIDDGKYQQDVPVEFVKDNANKLANIAVGDEVRVTFDLRGREYNGRYYPSLSGWKVEVMDGTGKATDTAGTPLAPVADEMVDAPLPF
jgi:single-strand DNA-binding protein